MKYTILFSCLFSTLLIPQVTPVDFSLPDKILSSVSDEIPISNIIENIVIVGDKLWLGT